MSEITYYRHLGNSKKTCTKRDKTYKLHFNTAKKELRNQQKSGLEISTVVDSTYVHMHKTNRNNKIIKNKIKSNFRTKV